MNERARSYRDRARSRRTQASGKESGSRSAMRMRRRQRAGAVPHSPLRGPFGQVEVARSTRHGRDGEHARRFGRRPNCRSALAGSGILLRMTTASGLSLNVTPEHGHVGDRVVLSPSGPDADHAVGGPHRDSRPNAMVSGSTSFISSPGGRVRRVRFLSMDPSQSERLV